MEKCSFGEILGSNCGPIIPPESFSTYKICAQHRHGLGIGLRGKRKRCQVPQELSNHKENPPIADRTIDKKHSCIIKSITAKLVPVGSGMFVYLTCSSGNLLFILLFPLSTACKLPARFNGLEFLRLCKIRGNADFIKGLGKRKVIRRQLLIYSYITILVSSKQKASKVM